MSLRHLLGPFGRVFSFRRDRRCDAAALVATSAVSVNRGAERSGEDDARPARVALGLLEDTAAQQRSHRHLSWRLHRERSERRAEMRAQRAEGKCN